MNKIYVLVYLGGVLASWSFFTWFFTDIHNISTFADSAKPVAIFVIVVGLIWPLVPIYTAHSSIYKRMKQ